MKFESSDGIVLELLMIMMCRKYGRTGDEEDRCNDGTMCFNNGICDRTFNFGVVMNTFVSQISAIENARTNGAQGKFELFRRIGRINDS